MIRRLHLENFKCLRDVTVDFTPLTVLIGPNDSGKSSILQALQTLSKTRKRPESLLPIQAAEERFSRIFSGDVLNKLVFRRDAARDIRWRIDGDLETRPFFYDLSLPGDVLSPATGSRCRGSITAPDKMRQSTAYLDSLQTTNIYKLEPDAIRKLSVPEPQPVLSSTGDNLATVLEAMMTGPDRQALRELEETLYKTIPTLRGISVPTVSIPVLGAPAGNNSPYKAIEFVLAGKERPPVTIPSAQVSDGALLLTAYLSIVYGETPDIILIEEPENGLHPTRLKMIVELLRKVTTGEVGNRKRQIVMTTHSPLLLNYCQPEEVRIVRRGEDGASQVTPLNDVPNIQKLLGEFAIGELWYMLTEEGLLRGDNV